ncbi:MAG: OprO/OprP family phosphate-selective porin [Spirochaetia bacterium]|nr:OprO/OprP family phosphate-selective porin [Spirochaetia bacterium]
MKKTTKIIKLLLSAFIFLGLNIFAQEKNEKELTETDKKATVADTLNISKEKSKKDDKYFEAGVRIQARMMAGEKDSKYADDSNYDSLDFNFRRLRLTGKFQGASWYGGVLDIKGENLLTKPSFKEHTQTITSGETVLAKGSKVEGKSAIQEANMWIKPGFWNSKIKFGQFKLPFLREQLTSSSRLLLPERSFSAETLQQQDIGISIDMHPPSVFGSKTAQIIDISLAVTNGDGSGHDGVGRKSVEIDSSGESKAKLYNWRFQLNPFGGIVKDEKDTGWADGKEIFNSSALFSLGVAGVYTSANEGGEFAKNKKLSGHTVDMTFAVSGVYINGEYTFFNGAAVPKKYHTYQATLGYNIPVKSFYLMPVLRYSHVQSDIDENGAVDNNEKLSDIWAGINFFGDKHDFKLQLFYQIKQDKSGENNSNLKDNIIYLQAQTNFGKKV